MARRTVYALYNKSALFAASVERAAARWGAPVATLRSSEQDDLKVALLATARNYLAQKHGGYGVRAAKNH